MKKEQKLITVTLLGLVMLALVVPFISAAVISATWNSPGNYTNQSTSFTYNCTTSAHAVRNITVYANSSSGTMNALQVFTNTSAAQTAWTGTVNIQAADDGAGQNLSCYADNGTNQVYSSEKGCTHTLLDSTDPDCSLSVLHSTIAWKGTQEITYSSSDALARRSTYLDVNGPEDQSTITLTSSGQTFQLASNDTNYIGSWTVNMTVTDWSGNTCTDSATFKSYLSDGAEQVQITPKPKSNMGALLVIAGLAVLAYFVFGRKK